MFTNRDTPNRTAASSTLNVAIRLFLEHHVRGVGHRIGDGRRVHHRLGLTYDGERLTHVRQVRLHVTRLIRLAPLPDRTRQIAGGHLVTRREQGADGRPADLAVGSGDDDTHRWLLRGWIR
ncbi:hypothetical protein GCM10020220_062540 [Nonomuraea rubra]